MRTEYSPDNPSESRKGPTPPQPREAIEVEVEQLQAENFGDVFALYNGADADDPGGVGTAPGSGFLVDGLNLLVGDADGFAGEVFFPVIDDASVLREDAEFAVMGMPRDLDGDGDIDGLDHSDDYQLLPVVVRVTWRTSTGQTSTYQLRTLLANY